MPNSMITTLWELRSIAPRSEKYRFIFLLGLSFIMALSELALAGMIALLGASFASPEAVLSKAPVLWLKSQLGVSFLGESRLLALSILCVILCIILVKNLLALLQQRQQAIFSESVGVAARQHVFRFYQKAPFVWLMSSGVAELHFGLRAAAEVATTLGIFLHICAGSLTLLILVSGLIYIAPLASLLFLGTLGVGGVVAIRGTRKLLDTYAQAAFSMDYQVSKVQHLALHGFKEIRLYRRENILFATYKEQLASFLHARVSRLTIARLPVYALETLGFLTLIGVMLFLVFIQDASMARISSIMGFLAAAAWRGLPIANRLVDFITDLRGLLPYVVKTLELGRVGQAMEQDLLTLAENDVSRLPFRQKVRMESMTFRYPESPTTAVENLSLDIGVGSMVGIVGLSGSGKSTLTNLLTGLVQPESGQLLVDGVRVTKDNINAWLQRIGYVSQTPYILDASLAENIALSCWGESIDRERIQECCRMAALDFLDELECGMDTVLGDRGARLSGGQAQRVAIARALYSNPDLIIFDEATSALDMKNEKAIHETILALRDKVTIVIVAHRLSSVEGCDSIVWLEKGQIHSIGPSEQVLRAYRMALQQTARESSEGAM